MRSDHQRYRIEVFLMLTAFNVSDSVWSYICDVSNYDEVMDAAKQIKEMVSLSCANEVQLSAERE